MNFLETIKNIIYSFSANLVSLCISVFMVMFVPKFLSVDDYGLWQLFLFYFSYLGFLHFGWEDGIYLRYAGRNFEELDRKTFAGQFYGIVILQFVLATLFSFIGQFIITDPLKKVALLCAIWLAPFVAEEESKLFKEMSGPNQYFMVIFRNKNHLPEFKIILIYK